MPTNDPAHPYTSDSTTQEAWRRASAVCSRSLAGRQYQVLPVWARVAHDQQAIFLGLRRPDRHLAQNREGPSSQTIPGAAPGGQIQAPAREGAPWHPISGFPGTAPEGKAKSSSEIWLQGNEQLFSEVRLTLASQCLLQKSSPVARFIPTRPRP